jgi:hypothetical protein
MASTRPAMGPATPMSNSWRRLAPRFPMRMTAPMVPKGGIGSGTK